MIEQPKRSGSMDARGFMSRCRCGRLVFIEDGMWPKHTAVKHRSTFVAGWPTGQREEYEETCEQSGLPREERPE